MLVESDGQLVSHTGVIVREASLDGADVRIGGIGGVMTHPEARRLRHAAAGIGRAMSFLRDEQHCAFGLLVCDDGLVPYYEGLRWRVFDGDLLTLQKGETVSDVAQQVHRGLATDLKFARIWGPSAEFEGQQVSGHHPVADTDVVELHW